MSKAKIKFWGVRGSLARPGTGTIKYGGNTPCLEIRYGRELLIIDAGTGIYGLGNALVKASEKIKTTILFSHYHWDHLVGLTFFLPVYNKQNGFT
ncbi:MAG: MBL fold metallo-hydrolase, partial [Deltaproteobacteria bacterium]|nr:MBL fold metallo-hydrolase [Deltaproteobacteria bacterium]